MKVYIDNNVLIDYKENRIALPICENVHYYYPHTHILELIELGNRLENQ